MKKNLLTWVFYISSQVFIFAQSGDFGMGARSASVGNTSITYGDEWALFNNIGALAQYNSPSVFTSFQNKYSVSSFTSMAIGAVYPILGGVSGIGIFRFGDDLYNEHKINFGFSNQFGIVSLGLNLNYYQINIEGAGGRKTFMIDFGGMAKITDQLFFGAHVSNLNQAQRSKVTHELIPTILKCGLSYRPNPELFVNAEVQKEIDQQTVLKLGIEHNVIDRFWIRTGIYNQPFKCSFGLGFYARILKTDYSFGANPNLGGIHEISITYLFKN